MFKGRAVLITGASGAFGSAIALQFAKESANLALTGRNLDKLNKVAEECKALGAEKVVPIVADLTKKNDLSQIISTTTSQLGRLDSLVNNAGYYVHHSLLQVTWEEIDDTFAVNVKAPLMLSQLAMPFLLKTKGCIVNISSATPPSQNPALVSRMSRGAVDQLTLNLASEFVKQGVRANVVKPALSKTGLTEAQLSDETFEERAKMQPLGGLLEQTDIADAVVFISSPKASKITGQFLLVDAGQSVMPRIP
ncbi:3-oxoacyl-[acyl-carrier-protein] reductase FabG [Ciona intestinalis]